MTERQIPTQAQVDAAWERWCAQSDLPGPYRVWLRGADHTDGRYAEWALAVEKRRTEPARPDDLAKLATRARFVDPSELICPSCGEQVRAVDDVSGEQFSHSDGTELCRGRGGRPGEPVER